LSRVILIETEGKELKEIVLLDVLEIGYMYQMECQGYFFINV
jgi:hypothetical protein